MTTVVPEILQRNPGGGVGSGGGVRSRGEGARKGRRHGKGTAIMKLTTMTQVTIDAVMQGYGAASQDRRNGFERGGWARGKGDDETRTLITQTYQRAEAFLFGRRTTARARDCSRRPVRILRSTWSSRGSTRRA
jgi:hypothetical protein